MVLYEADVSASEPANVEVEDREAARRLFMHYGRFRSVRTDPWLVGVRSQTKGSHWRITGLEGLWPRAWSHFLYCDEWHLMDNPKQECATHDNKLRRCCGAKCNIINQYHSSAKPRYSHARRYPICESSSQSLRIASQ